MAKRQKETRKSFSGDGWSVNATHTQEPHSALVVPPALHRLRVQVAKTKHGRLVTEVQPLQLDAEDAAALLAALKKRCGAGGTLADSVLTIQGEHVDNIRRWLKDNGWGVRS